MKMMVVLVVIVHDVFFHSSLLQCALNNVYQANMHT